MRALYDQLLKEGEAGIHRIFAERMQESLELDFKRKENDRNGEFSTNDRRMLAEALSGFANSAGGLLVLGVDARQGPDRIDCAQEARPIVNIQRFLSEANTEISRLVQPRLDGVTVAAIESQTIEGAGYLLVHVERSERRPHRSEAKGQKGYYKRHGDGFFEMEHYDIEDAFSRESSPYLEIHHTIERAVRSEQFQEFDIRIYLRNVSNFIAKHPYVVLDSFSGCSVNNSFRSQPFKVERGSRSTLFSGSMDDVIHPDTEKHAASLKVQFDLDANDGWVNGVNRSIRMVEFCGVHGCEGGRATRYRIGLGPGAFNLES